MSVLFLAPPAGRAAERLTAHRRPFDRSAAAPAACPAGTLAMADKVGSPTGVAVRTALKPQALERIAYIHPHHVRIRGSVT